MTTDIISSNPDFKFAAHLRMASAIVDTIRRNGKCLPQDLLQAGFAMTETADRWHMARAMADVELKLTASP